MFQYGRQVAKKQVKLIWNNISSLTQSMLSTYKQDTFFETSSLSILDTKPSKSSVRFPLTVQVFPLGLCTSQVLPQPHVAGGTPQATVKGVTGAG